MDSSVRKAALKAAAKTAIMLSLSGCFLAHERSDPTPPTTRTDAGGVRRDAAVAVARDAGRDAGPLDCDRHLASLAIMESPSGWGSTFIDEAARNDPRTGDCCVELDEVAMSAGTPIDGVSEGLAMACCDVIVNVQSRVGFSSLGCTPWGPPCPPEMPFEPEPELALG